MDLLKLEIVTPEGLIFSQNIKSVTLPGSEGEFGVLPGHAALISLLKVGVIDIELENGEHEIVAINWGHATIDEEKVTVLAEGAVSVGGDNESDIAKALDSAKRLIESMSDSDVAIAAATAKIDTIARAN
ncbi:MAG: F0F1 ATP synthase subunit epsilon [Proteobacteria bacterium]|nr:MAG: F0F1 ATP synthase subunit epsilon [Pseudomonadota bacterium]